MHFPFIIPLCFVTLARAKFDFYLVFSEGEHLIERGDPIKAPGGPSAHAHVIFGSNAFGINATTESLRADTTCSTVGSNNPAYPGPTYDRSSYWTPALYAQARDGSGLVYIHQSGQKVYYTDPGPPYYKNVSLNFPDGNFHTIAGWPNLRTPTPDKYQRGVHTWTCNTGTQGIDGVDGAFPDIPDEGCGKDGGSLMAEIWFPDCIDASGTNVTYTEGIFGCPDTNSIRIPTLRMEIFFNLTESVAAIVDPKTLVLANGDPTGYSFHADFLNGWDQDGVAGRLASCTAPNNDLDKFDGITNCNYTPYGSNIARKDCKIPSSFNENVGLEAPIPALPGCNPISTATPTDRAPAPIGKGCADAVSIADKSVADEPAASSASSFGAGAMTKAVSTTTGSAPESDAIAAASTTAANVSVDVQNKAVIDPTTSSEKQRSTVAAKSRRHKSCRG